MRVLACGMLALCSGLASATSPVPAVPSSLPELQIRQKLVRYQIEGLDIADLRAELGRDRRSGADAGSHGRTRSEIGLRYELVEDERGCGAADVRIELDVTTLLPEWRPLQEVAPGLLDRWHSAIDALGRHEAVHRDHVFAAARDLQSRLAGVGWRPDCHALRNAIERHVFAVKLKCQFRDARFDARTRNGSAQGAVL